MGRTVAEARHAAKQGAITAPTYKNCRGNQSLKRCFIFKAIGENNFHQ
jgi:hypothetical protein